MEKLLTYSFTQCLLLSYTVAIVASVISQVITQGPAAPVASLSSYTFYGGGFLNAFDVSIFTALLMFLWIGFMWPENYGESSSEALFVSAHDAIQRMNVLLIGI